MDECAEDKSEKSFERHLAYYKSLSRIIKEMEMEIKAEDEEGIKNHLKDRIKAINLDKERIEKMFPEKEFKDE